MRGGGSRYANQALMLHGLTNNFTEPQTEHSSVVPPRCATANMLGAGTSLFEITVP